MSRAHRARRVASKYKAKPTVVDGIRFHSQKEARRYQELKLLERAGEIRHLHCQPKLTLYSPELHSNEFTARKHKIGAYFADFAYVVAKSGECVYEDAKGFKTPLYRWKKKHVEAQYGITIREV